jgi:hypothetical protein
MLKCFRIAIFGILVMCPAFAQVQHGWNWDVETITPDGRFTSVVTDSLNNIYASFATPDGIKFGFRPAGPKQKWFLMGVGLESGFTSIALDSKSNPWICFNGHGSLFVAQLIKGRFQIQPIAPHTGTLAYSCSVALSRDDAPAVTWYHEKTPDGVNYLHFKYAFLRDQAWRAKSVDMEMQTGKWHSMKIDSHGHPVFVYDSFVNGLIKFATFDGTNWKIEVIDGRGKTADDYSLGMGNSFVLDSADRPHVSYYTNSDLRYAIRDDQNKWKVEKVDTVSPGLAWLGYRSSLVLDKAGMPHIFYQDLGALKHAYKEDGVWKYQLIVAAGETDPYEYQSATLDKAGHIILLFRDPADGMLKAAISKPTADDTKTQSVAEDATPKPGPAKAADAKTTKVKVVPHAK